MIKKTEKSWFSDCPGMTKEMLYLIQYGWFAYWLKYCRATSASIWYLGDAVSNKK